jgi:hypothetical protein
MRKLFGLLLLVGLCLSGCRDNVPPSPKYRGDVVQDLINGLDSPTDMTRLLSVRRLGELGDEAQKAIPALRAFAQKHPKFKPEVDASIARIQSGAPRKK